MAQEYLKRTPTSSGNSYRFTISVWAKRNSDATSHRGHLFNAGPSEASSNDRFAWYLNSGHNLHLSNRIGGTYGYYMTPPAKYQDYSGWTHYLASVDTTHYGDQENKAVEYVNGVLQSAASNAVDPIAQNYESWINQRVGHYIGKRLDNLNGNWHGQMMDLYLVDGQALTPDVFGFYKDGNGYISAGSTQATDFRPGQWVPKTPRIIKAQIERNGGFGVNGFYLPMNDSSNFGADFHTTPNSIITLKGEDLPQPRNGAPTTTDAYVSQLRTDPYAANLVLAVPGISTSTSANLITNGTFDTDTTGWTAGNSAILSVESGRLKVTNGIAIAGYAYQAITVEIGKRYTISLEGITGTSASNIRIGNAANGADYGNKIGSGLANFSIAPTQTTIYIAVKPNSNTNGNNAFFDNVIVREENAPRDYSADIKGSGTNKTLTGNGDAGVGYQVPSYYGSALSFNGSGDYLETTLSAFGTNDFTIEYWINPYSISGSYVGTVRLQASTSEKRIEQAFQSSTLQIYTDTNAWRNTGFAPPTNQWTHIALEKYNGYLTVYANGVAVWTATNTRDYDESFDVDIANHIDQFNGYMQDVRVYKGVAKYKGGFDVPKPYTPVGIGTWRAVSDTTANNFATWNALQSSIPLTDGNLTCTGSGSNQETYSTVGITTGKWYVEARTNVGTYNHFGLRANSTAAYNTPYRLIARDDGNVYGDTSEGLIASLSDNYNQAGDIVAMAIDGDNGQVTYYINGVNVGGPYSIYQYSSAPTPYKVYNLVNSGNSLTVNFGQNPTFSGNTTAGTFTDSNGKGLFKYEPPSGFLALCEDNLPTPAIKNPGEYFKTVLWTGDGNVSREITGVGFAPDLVWIKSRSFVNNHHLFDVIRGPNNILRTSTSGGETNPGNVMTSFNSDGFTVGEDGGNNATNDSGSTFVAWCWRAGAGTTTANTAGSIPSVVSVNQDAGFSIVSYTGNGTNATVGHGLNKTPKFIITKNRDASVNWIIYHSSVGATQYLRFTTNEATTQSSIFNDTEPTSSVFSLGSSTTPNGNGQRQIAYCWAEIEGFSKFGSFEANGNVDGPFVYLGFKPAFLICKNIDATESWLLKDSSRQPTNPNEGFLLANTNGVENFSVGNDVDFLSNGFKIRTTNNPNTSGSTYIFAAFAESPINYSNAK
jgi:hypothetical protein